MSKKLGIIISLVLALIFTGLIVYSSQRELRAETKTVTAYQANHFISMGQEISPSDVKKVEVPEKIASNMVTDANTFNDAVTTQNIGNDQYVFKNSLTKGVAVHAGYGEIIIPVDLSKSCLASPGDYVNVYPIGNVSNGEFLEPIYQKARVTRALDKNGTDIDPSATVSKTKIDNGKAPVAIGLEVPLDKMKMLVGYASGQKVYLTKCSK